MALAGVLECSGAIDEAERLIVRARGNILDDPVDARVGPKAQGIQVQGALIVSFGLLMVAKVFERRSETEMGIGIARVDLKRCLEMRDSIIPVPGIGALGATAGCRPPLVDLLV